MFTRVERDRFWEGFLTSTKSIKTAVLSSPLFRDQGVGGSNPLSPTIYSQAAHCISEDAILWISTIWVRLKPVGQNHFRIASRTALPPTWYKEPVRIS